MSLITYEDPVILDSTGQAIVDAIDRLTASRESDVSGLITTFTESTTTASRAYAPGDLLFYDGKLYTVKRPITKDTEIIITGVNPHVEETTIDEAKQSKRLNEPIYVSGIAKHTVETALDAINDETASNKSSLMTKVENSILNGSSINDFAGVESALNGKVDKTTSGGVLGSDGEKINLEENIGVFTSAETGKKSLYVQTSNEVPKEGYSSIPTSNAVDTEFSNIIASEFRRLESYNIDDYVKREGKLYKCTTAHTGNWDASHFSEVKLANEVQAIKDGSTIDSFSDVETALNGKQNTLTFDNVPTQYSNNPVKSGGLWTEELHAQQAIAYVWGYVSYLNAGDYVYKDGILYQCIEYHTGDWNNNHFLRVDDGGIANRFDKGKISWSDAKKSVQKNLLKNNAVSKSVGGVLFAVNSDKSVTPASGTISTADNLSINTDVKLKTNTQYILSGGIESGKSVVLVAFNGDTYVKNIAASTGADETFTVDYDGYNRIQCNCYAGQGKTFNGYETYKPMIRKASIADNTYEPYIPNNEEIVINVTNVLRDAKVINGKNLANQNGTNVNNGYVYNHFIDATGNIQVSSSGYVILEYIPVKPNTTYTINGVASNNANGFIEYDVNKEVVTYGVADPMPYTFTTSANTYFIRINRKLTDIQVQVEEGSVATAYEPYYIPLKDSMFPRSEQAVLGAKNLAPIIAKNVTNKGITLTFNEDDSVVVSGTATEAVGFEISERGQWLKNGERYKLSGCKGGAADKYKLDIAYIDTGFLAIDYDEDEVEFTANNARNYMMRIVVYAGQTMNNVVIKPMVRLATDTDPTYAPHAMTNKELTEQFVNKSVKSELTSSNMTIDEAFLSKAGNIYAYALKLTANSNIAASAVIIDTGLIAPKPMYDRIANAVFQDTSNNVYHISFISQSGVTKLFSTEAIANGVSIRGTITFTR